MCHVKFFGHVLMTIGIACLIHTGHVRDFVLNPTVDLGLVIIGGLLLFSAWYLED